MVMSSDLYADDDFAIQMIVAGIVASYERSVTRRKSVLFGTATPVSVLQPLHIDVESNVLEPQDKGDPAHPGMSSRILGSSSSFTRPKSPPPMTSENVTQTGTFSIHHVPIATSWTLPMPWGVIPSGKTMSTQTIPKDTVEPRVQENVSKKEISFKFDQDFKIFRDHNNDDYFGSINEFDGFGILGGPDHSGVYIVNATSIFRNVATNTIHVPWRRVSRRVPKFKKWIKASKTWSKSKEMSTFGTQTEEHIPTDDDIEKTYSYYSQDFASRLPLFSPDLDSLYD